MDQAQKVLARLEKEAKKVGLLWNSKKTEIKNFKSKALVIVKAKNGNELKIATNVKYLGA